MFIQCCSVHIISGLCLLDLVFKLIMIFSTKVHIYRYSYICQKRSADILKSNRTISSFRILN
jgi:hypothetical protein